MVMIIITMYFYSAFSQRFKGAYNILFNLIKKKYWISKKRKESN